MHQIRFPLGLRPRLRWDPDPLAVFKGPTSKGREGEEEGKGRNGEGTRWERGGEGRGEERRGGRRKEDGGRERKGFISRILLFRTLAAVLSEPWQLCPRDGR